MYMSDDIYSISMPWHKIVCDFQNNELLLNANEKKEQKGTSPYIWAVIYQVGHQLTLQHLFKRLQKNRLNSLHLFVITVQIDIRSHVLDHELK